MLKSTEHRHGHNSLGWMRLFWFLSVLLLSFSSSAYCQTNSGTLVGTVQDSSAAAISNAKITVTNTQTGVTTGTVTSGTGDYRVPQLIPGTYTVRAEASGFQAEAQTDVFVDVSRTTTVNLTLQVGNTKQAVTVRATNVGIETQTSQVATSVPEQMVEELPLSNSVSGEGNRDVTDLQFLTPGTVGSSWQGTVAGGQRFAGEILMDGNSMDSFGGNTSDVVNEVPSIEGIQEFTVLSTGMSAEYGRTNSGIVNLVSKSGTSRFHGLGYDIIRNKDFDANTWFNNFFMGTKCVGANNTPSCRAGFATPQDHKNDYGANLGGPVWIPHLYDGRDKTFFFFNWEQASFGSGGLNVVTLPTAANRAGDFSANLTSKILVQNNPCDNNNPIYQGQIFDPSTTQTINNVTCRKPFPNNMIPSGSFSKVAQNVLSYVPLPNGPGLTNNYISPYSIPLTSTFETIRIDHSFGNADKIFGSYNTNEFHKRRAPVIYTPADNSSKSHLFTHDINAGWDHFFSPSVENRLNLAYWRFLNVIQTVGVLANQNWPQTLGISGLSGAPPSPFPNITFAQGGYLQYGVPGAAQFFNAQNRITLSDQLSWVKGKHTFKFGEELRAGQFTGYSKGAASGRWFFANAETAGISTSNTQNGNSFASFLLGQIQSANAISILWYPRYSQYYAAVYAQDDFKVTRTLTLNLGLRWDVDRPFHATYNNSSLFDPTLPNPGAGGRLGALAFAGSGPGRTGRNDAWEPTTLADFGPRIGFAYAPRRFHDKTAIRGSYDIIYGQTNNQNVDVDQAGFTASSSYSDSSSIGGFSGTPFTWDQGYPPLATTVNTDPTQLNGQPINANNQGSKPSRLQIWDLQVQHLFAPDLAFTLAYVGNHATRLGSRLLLPNALPQQYWALGSKLTQPVVGNPYGIPVPYPGFKGTIANALRPYPQYLAISEQDQSVGQSTYEALWASLQRHFRNGLTLLFAYTWSKNISNAEYWCSTCNVAPQNPFNISQERALAGLNVPQNISLAYTYQLPVGRGKRFLNNSRLLDDILGGWSIGGIQNYASGSPISFGCANSIPGTDNCVRWNFVGTNLLSDAERSGHFNPGVDNYFLNPGQVASQVFVDPEKNVAQGGGYQLGNLSRYVAARGYQGIGTSGLMESFSVTKQFLAGERAHVDLRVELLNAFNRHQFQVPDSNPNDLGFGRVTASQILPRQLQLTARISF